MTLEEAIEHCEEVAESRCDEYREEHRQITEWLEKLLKERIEYENT